MSLFTADMLPLNIAHLNEAAINNVSTLMIYNEKDRSKEAVVLVNLKSAGLEQFVLFASPH